MRTIENIPSLESRATHTWSHVLLETMLALVSTLLVTGCIDMFHLYPLIPDISIIYLFVILGLASTVELYAATPASITAFLSFDYFIVPPLDTFTINRLEEWIALFVFLAVALFTSKLTTVVCQHTREAQRRERESKILYELIRNAEILPS